MEIVDEATHRVLAYVQALNRHGVRPHRTVVDEFGEAPERRFSQRSNMAAFDLRSQLTAIWSMQRVAEETFCQFLTRLGWIQDEEGGVALTVVGRALLKSLNAPAIEESTAYVFEIVLDPKNPFAYAQALSGLSSVTDALLVEPYFRLEQLMDVAELENVNRVLVGSNLKATEYDLLATGLAALPEGRTLEIRKAAELHDRYLIPAAEGHVIMLGASLGGIGRKVSTMTTLGELASQALRDAHEGIWNSGARIEPKVRVTGRTASSTQSRPTKVSAKPPRAATGRAKAGTAKATRGRQAQKASD